MATTNGDAPLLPAPDPPRTLVLTWAKAILGLAIARALSPFDPTGILAKNLAGVAALLFIALADARVRRGGGSWAHYGVPGGSLRDPATYRAFARGALRGLGSSALVLPLFGLLFAGYALLLPRFSPSPLGAALPDLRPAHAALRLPPDLLLRALLQILVVALPEELFYRGWMQTSWARGAPGRGVRVLGARLGAGFFSTQILFAAGHLVLLDPLRLVTFLPGLWFGWLRERTGGVAAPVLAHALSNLFLQALEASFYGG
ncbi:MAG TPA: CPBP family intramembrane glutamic endopeptidase [Anaeromyxobacter sp.]|nr:CPBP family intramembrane glutamic endopeptidase [Anaeromyxobacter sp.]